MDLVFFSVFHIFRFITCVICSALHVIYCAVYGLAVKQKMKEEWPVGLLLARNRKQILSRARSENMIVNFTTFLCLSTINKRNMNFIFPENLSSEEIAQGKRVYEYFLPVKLTVK